MTEVPDDIPIEEIEKMFPDVNPANIVTPLQMKKRLTWDVVPCETARQVVGKMGMQVGSDDVAEMDHRESHRRLDAIAPLTPFIMPMSRDAAEAVLTAIMVHNDIEDIPDGEKEESVERFGGAIAAGAIGILAELVDTGIVHLPHVAYGTMGMGVE